MENAEKKVVVALICNMIKVGNSRIERSYSITPGLGVFRRQLLRRLIIGSNGANRANAKIYAISRLNGEVFFFLFPR